MYIDSDNFSKLAEFGYTDRGDHYAKTLRWGQLRFRNTVHTVRIDKTYGTVYVQTDIGVYESAPKVLPNIKDIMHLVRRD